MQATIKSTLGPYGGDLLMVDANGRQTITNDGATVMKVRMQTTPPPRAYTVFAQVLIFASSWTLSTLLPGSLSTSRVPKMRKWVTEQPRWSSWPARS